MDSVTGRMVIKKQMIKLIMSSVTVQSIRGLFHCADYASRYVCKLSNQEVDFFIAMIIAICSDWKRSQVHSQQFTIILNCLKLSQTACDPYQIL